MGERKTKELKGRKRRETLYFLIRWKPQRRRAKLTSTKKRLKVRNSQQAGRKVSPRP